MADSSLVQPICLLQDVNIDIHGILYIVALTVIKCDDFKSDYCMLLGRRWLRNAKIVHNWENDSVQIMGNGTVKIKRQLGIKEVTPAVFVCYNLVEGITDEEEGILLATDDSLHPLGTIDWTAIPSKSCATESLLPEIPNHVFPHSVGNMPVDETPIHEKIKLMDVAK